MTCFDEEPEHQPSKEDWEAFEQSQFPAWQPIETAPRAGKHILLYSLTIDNAIGYIPKEEPRL